MRNPTMTMIWHGNAMLLHAALTLHLYSPRTVSLTQRIDTRRTATAALEQQVTHTRTSQQSFTVAMLPRFTRTARLSQYGKSHCTCKLYTLHKQLHQCCTLAYGVQYRAHMHITAPQSQSAHARSCSLLLHLLFCVSAFRTFSTTTTMPPPAMKPRTTSSAENSTATATGNNTSLDTTANTEQPKSSRPSPFRHLTKNPDSALNAERCGPERKGAYT